VPLIKGRNYGFQIGRGLAPTYVINLTATFNRDGSKATVFGHAKGENGYAFYIQKESGRPDDIAQAVAASGGL
jgi:hypothetical protein